MQGELEALIRLNGTPGLGPKSIRDLIDKFGSATNVLRGKPEFSAETTKLNEKILAALRLCPGPEFAEEQLMRAQRLGVEFIPFTSSNYPPVLKNIAQPPVLLHLLGALPSASHFTAGVVGTRHPTPYGCRVAEEVTHALVAFGAVVVSGMALGIDTIAHRVALDDKGLSVAVLGCGVDIAYPKENSFLYSRLAEQGALLSEFPLGTGPLPGHFPRRNRIISGLSKILTVIEAGEKSGALITADFALDQGKEIFAVPGSIYSPQSSGTNRLLQQGAHPLLSARDLQEALGAVQGMSKSKPGPLIPLDEGEARIVSLLTSEPSHIDEIARKGDMPMHALHPLLLSLQLKGQITELAGMNYIRNRGES